MDLHNPQLIDSPQARYLVYAGMLVLVLLTVRFPFASDLNGFVIEDPLVPASEIHHGGPSRGGIPALDRPRFVAARSAAFLVGDDRVLGVILGGEARAYPIRILNYHEIVNDEIGGEHVVISYCPLCGTGIAFDARVAGVARTFAVSGLLYNSDLLLYDRQSESLWSQIEGQAINGPLKGERLARLPLVHTTWQDWRRRHPDTRVLSTATGYRRDYSRDPYPGYAQSEGLYFPVNKVSRLYHPKEQVIGVEIGGQRKVYPFSELSRGTAVLEDSVAGKPIRIEFDAEQRSGRVLDAQGALIPSVTGYWFAWFAFYPDSEIYRAAENAGPAGVRP